MTEPRAERSDSPPSNTVFEAVGGLDGVRRLAHAWHERVRVDEVAGHAFEQRVHPDHTERLAAYWGEATTTMAAYPLDANEVPDGLTLPRWSWAGLLEES